MFFTKAVYFQTPSRISIVPVNDYWSWLEKISPANTAEQELGLQQMFALGNVQSGVEERQPRGVYI